MTDLSELLTVPEAARVAGVSERTMRRWATNGQVRSIGRGHRRRVVAASLSEPAATALIRRLLLAVVVLTTLAVVGTLAPAWVR